jgi:hypothetical protein
MSEHHSHTIRVIKLTLCHILHSVSHWPVLVYSFNQGYPASQQQVLGMQRTQLDYYYTQGIPT